MRSVLAATAVWVAVSAAPADAVVKKTIAFDGHPRVYHQFVPDSAAKHHGAAPVLFLLHGSGRDGRSILDPWMALARAEGIVLLSPESLDRQGWALAVDRPELFDEVLKAVESEMSVDPGRVYLFGHSSGGHTTLQRALLESEFFAAAAVHAGALVQSPEVFAGLAVRKIPLAMWSGTSDALVPIQAVRASRDFLVGRGFPVSLNEMKGHTHDYYGSAASINREAWTFLSRHRLDDPRFQPYQTGRGGGLIDSFAR